MYGHITTCPCTFLLRMLFDYSLTYITAGVPAKYLDYGDLADEFTKNKESLNKFSHEHGTDPANIFLHKARMMMGLPAVPITTTKSEGIALWKEMGSQGVTLVDACQLVMEFCADLEVLPKLILLHLTSP